MLRRTRLAFSLIVCLALAGCGGGEFRESSAGKAPQKEQDSAARFKLASTRALDWESLRFSMSMTSAIQGPISFLGGADGDIEELGTEIVRNTPTTHYRFNVDLAASAAALPPELAEAVKPMFEEMPATFPAEAWVDEDNMVRRIRYSMALPGEEGQPAESIDTQMEFFDFGAEVEISEPGAAEVMDLGRMLQEAG